MGESGSFVFFFLHMERGQGLFCGDSGALKVMYLSCKDVNIIFTFILKNIAERRWVTGPCMIGQHWHELIYWVMRITNYFAH